MNQEGYLNGKTPEQEINNIKSSDIRTNIRNLNSADTQLTIAQYVIKGSYNSAVTENYVSLDMLQYVLSRGCRFIDFEVFYLDGKPMVSYSYDPNFAILESNNQLLLDNVLASAVANGFNSPSPNKDDPLFIQLRIKAHDNVLYKEVAKSINNTLTTRLYKGKVTKTTKMSDLMGKVVLVMDRTIDYKYTDYIKCSDIKDKTCYDLSKFINMESGSEFMRTSDSKTITDRSINPPTVNDNNVTTDVQYIQIVTPNNGSNPNLNSINLIKNYGCQVILFPFYIKNEALNVYEELFNDVLYGIVPLSGAIIYLKTDPRGILKTAENIKMPSLNINPVGTPDLTTLFSDNTNAIIIGSVLGGVGVLLIVGAIMANTKKKTPA